MLCQATRTETATVELPSQSPDGPYHLSGGAAERLKDLALRPLEWFNLATIHGPFEFYLHDDFYSDNGEAWQPERAVLEPERFPCPSLAECSSNLSRLLDFALTRWHLEQPIVEAFAPHEPGLLQAIEMRFAAVANPWFHKRLMELAGAALERRAEEWIRRVMCKAEPYARVCYLSVAYPCLPVDEGMQLAQQALASIPPGELAAQCLVLARFRHPAVLDWIEQHVREPLTYQWGDLAAASLLDWARVARWLHDGRPLSLIALDALAACAGPRPSQSLLMQRLRPRLRADVPVSVIEDALREYVARDPAPRVVHATRFVVERLPLIVATE
jgi:hypothetical protein